MHFVELHSKTTKLPVLVNLDLVEVVSPLDPDGCILDLQGNGEQFVSVSESYDQMKALIAGLGPEDWGDPKNLP